ncbi:MAG: dihydrolipoamide acetyltransferase family protein [Chloroflexota bacterium]|nr:dihydrolipoamide acetyltransferase family protein [Chloroflexota bacterium]
MPIIIQLPQVGESVTEGVIGKWLVGVGQRVEKYDPIVEVTTDKVSMEVPAPYAGALTRIIAQEGEAVPMGHPIAEIEIERNAALDDANEPEPPVDREVERRARIGEFLVEQANAGLKIDPRPSPEPPAESEPEPPLDREAERRARIGEFLEDVRAVGPTGSGEGGAGRPDAALAEPQAAPVLAQPAPPPPAPAPTDAEADDETLPSEGGESIVSPLVRRIAQEHGVDVSEVHGTGRDRRVTRDDIFAHLEARREPELEAEHTIESPAEQAQEEPAEPDDGSLKVALTPTRRAIAERMERAGQIPAAWAMVEVDATGLVAARSAHREAFERERGAPLTYLAFAAHATAQALGSHPALNARWAGEHVKQYPTVNLGIAVAANDGLIVPVIHGAERLSVADLASAIHVLAQKARAQMLDLGDVQGGTFTLNNTGSFGSVLSGPLINHPQAAILTTEAIVKRPVVVAGDAITVRPMMNLCAAFDHRVCDGVEVGALLAEVKARIEALTAVTPIR